MVVEPGAVDSLVRAAGEATAIAPSVATSLYEQALALLGPDDDRRIEIELACLEPMARAGGIAAARSHGDALLATIADPEQRRRLHAELAAVLATSGDLATSTEHYRAAGYCASQEPRGSTSAAASLMRCLASGQSVLIGGDLEEIRVQLEQELATAEDPYVECAAFQGLALAAGAAGCFDLAVTHALEADRRFDPLTMPRAGFLIPEIWVGSFEAFRDRFDDGTACFERVGYEADRRGERPTVVQTATALGLVAYLNGRWDDATRHLHTVLAIAAETRADAQLVAAHAVLAGIARGRGDAQVAATHLGEGQAALARGLHLFGVDLLIWLNATAALADDDPDSAFGSLWGLWEMTTSMRGLTHFRSIAPDLVRLAVLIGRIDEAALVVAQVEALAECSSAASVSAAAQRCRAHLDRDADGLIQAAEALAGTPWKLDLARTRAEAADALLASGSYQHAATMADAAVIEFARMGATADVARIVAKHGSGRAGSDPTRSPHDAWATLSPRELEVVELLAEGWSNPAIADKLYISRRTVESHVASALRKVGVTNRTQLATIATERDARRRQ